MASAIFSPSFCRARIWIELIAKSKNQGREEDRQGRKKEQNALFDGSPSPKITHTGYETSELWLVEEGRFEPDGVSLFRENLRFSFSRARVIARNSSLGNIRANADLCCSWHEHRVRRTKACSRLWDSCEIRFWLDIWLCVLLIALLYHERKCYKAQDVQVWYSSWISEWFFGRSSIIFLAANSSFRNPRRQKEEGAEINSVFWCPCKIIGFVDDWIDIFSQSLEISRGRQRREIAFSPLICKLAFSSIDLDRRRSPRSDRRLFAIAKKNNNELHKETEEDSQRKGEKRDRKKWEEP